MHILETTTLQFRMPHAQSKAEPSRFFSVEAVPVALPNLPQTFRGRERSKTKKGYASHPLSETEYAYGNRYYPLIVKNK